MRKNMMPFGFAILLGATLISCNSDKSKVKDNTTNFFEYINKKDFLHAEQYATASSKELLEILKKYGEEDKSALKPSTEKILVDSIVIHNDTATALVSSQSEPHPVTVKLLKEKGQWKVAFDKNAIMEMSKNEAPIQDKESTEWNADTTLSAPNADTTTLSLPQ